MSTEGAPFAHERNDKQPEASTEHATHSDNLPRLTIRVGPELAYVA